jgi:hypothetical protein
MAQEIARILSTTGRGDKSSIRAAGSIASLFADNFQHGALAQVILYEGMFVLEFACWTRVWLAPVTAANPLTITQHFSPLLFRIQDAALE